MAEFTVDPLFKGATRPALFIGVPLVPLALVIGITVLLMVYFTFLFFLPSIPVVAVMRMMTKSDDQIFKLLGLKARFRAPSWVDGTMKFWKGCNSYSPMAYKVRKK